MPRSRTALWLDVTSLSLLCLLGGGAQRRCDNDHDLCAAAAAGGRPRTAIAHAHLHARADALCGQRSAYGGIGSHTRCVREIHRCVVGDRSRASDEVCLVLLFHRQLGAQALVIGSIAGNLGAVAILWRLVRRLGIPLRIVEFRSSQVVRSLMKVSTPLIISQSVLQLNPFIDRTTSAQLGPGSVTTFELGVRIFAASSTLLTGVVIAPLAATWSDRLAVEGWGAVVRSFRRVVTAVVTVVPPILCRVPPARPARHPCISQPRIYAICGGAHGRCVWNPFDWPPSAGPHRRKRHCVHRPPGNDLPDESRHRQLCAECDPRCGTTWRLGVAGIALSTTVTLTVLCIVYLREAQHRWGSLELMSVGRVATISFGSCAAIAVTGALTLTLFPTSPSRLAAIGSIGAVLLVAGGIHGVVMGVNGLTQHGGLRNAVTRVWPAAAAISSSMRPRPSGASGHRNRSSR